MESSQLEACISSLGVTTTFDDNEGLVVHMLIEKNVSFEKKEILMQNAHKRLKLESEEESTMAHWKLIRFIKKGIADLES
ncbi:hypothetical protein Tco_0347248 [Tanacetum coccineum]